MSRNVIATGVVDEIFNNEYFIREIILRVPAKQLIKFKSVCKQWLAIIDDVQFGYDHTSQNPNPPDLGLYFYKTIVPFTTMGLKTIPHNGTSSFPPLEFLDRAKIVDTCNGLALALHVGDIHSVCNLTTQKYRILPKVIDVNMTKRRVYECLAFDPAKSPHYKVIFMYYTKHCADKIMIFSSEKDSWKEIPLSLLPTGVPATRIIYLNGLLHWISTTLNRYEFEVETGELKGEGIAQNPKILIEEIRYFGECGGHLYLAKGGLFTYMCTIFEMEWDTRMWISMYRINFRNIICQRVDKGAKFYVLNIVQKSNHGGLTLVLATPGGFVSYNRESRILEGLSDFMPSEFDEIPRRLSSLHSYSYRFTESLFPI